MRFLVRVLFLAATLLLIFPFLAASLLVDQRGISIRGHVHNKSEYITVGYSTWLRHLEAQVQYETPDDRSFAITGLQLEQTRFDSLRKNDAIQLRYLLRKDLPNWPGFRTMRQMHVLPFVRLASENTWSGPAKSSGRTAASWHLP